MQQREHRSPIHNGRVQLQRATHQSSPQEYDVLNISRGGLCFQSQDSFELNETVSLKVSIEQEAILTAKGRVCYRNTADASQASNYGLSFLDNFIDADYIRQHK